MTRPPWGPVLAFSCHLRGCLVCQDPRLLSPRPSIRAPLVLIKTCGLASEGLLHCHYWYIAPGFRKPHTVPQPGGDEPPQGKCTSIESRSERSRENVMWNRERKETKTTRVCWCTPALESVSERVCVRDKHQANKVRCILQLSKWQLSEMKPFLS